MPLVWDNRSAVILAAALDADVDIGEGYAAIFVPLDETSGVKLFPKAEWRDYAIEKQRLAHQHGVGPEVGDSFELDAAFLAHPKLQWKGYNETGVLQYGYLTERADTSVEPTPDEIKNVIDRLTTIAELQPPSVEEFEDNPANYGKVRGGWVFIDFDRGTWE